jgi:hypothetical protein
MYVAKIELFEVEYSGELCSSKCKHLCRDNCYIFGSELNEVKFNENGDKNRLKACIRAEELFKQHANIFLGE